MEKLTAFKFERKQVRVVSQDGETWFVAKDVCKVLGYTNTSKAVKDHVRDLDKLNNDSLSSLGQRGGWLINEAGMYSLILRSNKPEALVFQDWVTHEVLPAIRQRGAYVSADITAEQVEELQAELERLKPLALYAEMLEVSDSVCSVGELTALLTQAGFKIGRNSLFDMLRTDGYLIKKTRSDKNMPTRKAIQQSLIVIDQRNSAHPNGAVHTYRQPKITGKGQLYFLKRYAQKQLVS